MEKAERVFRYKNLEKRFTIFRWVLLIIISPISFSISEYTENNHYLILAVLIYCIYNLFVTIAAYSKKNRFSSILETTIYADVLLISILLFIRGGMRSDVFFLYFLIISYNGAKFGYKGTISSIIQTVIYFSISAFMFTPQDVFSFNRYIIRISYIVMTSYVIYQVNKIVYESYNREKQAKCLAMKDFLTNLPNRLSLSECSAGNQKFEEFGQTFSIVMFDVDDFKQINDSNGHIYGDSVLVKLATIISNNISSNDFACRFGGEEFVIIFANSDIKKATTKANKIRVEFKKEYSLSDKITLSGGISEYNHSYSMIENINDADKKMYIAKKTGKDKIVG